MTRPEYSPADFAAALIRKRETGAYAKAEAALQEQAKRSALTIIRTRRRDPLITPADLIVQQCLRAFRDIPAQERMFGRADLLSELIELISFVYLESSHNEKEHRRRAYALLQIAGGE